VLACRGSTLLVLEMAEAGLMPPGSTMSVSAHGALKPDTYNLESEFEVENNKFAFSPGQLGKLYNPKSLAAFYALGGLEGIEKGLKTNQKAGNALRGPDGLEMGLSTDRRAGMSDAVILFLSARMFLVACSGFAATYRSSTDGLRGYVVAALLGIVWVASVGALLASIHRCNLTTKLEEFSCWLGEQMGSRIHMALSSLHRSGNWLRKVLKSLSVPTRTSIRTSTSRVRVSSCSSPTVFASTSPSGRAPGPAPAPPGSVSSSPVPDPAPPLQEAVELQEIAEHGNAAGLGESVLLEEAPGLEQAAGLGNARGGHITASPLLGGLSLFSLFTPSYAQGPTVGAHNRDELDWRQRAIGALTDNLVTLASLLVPFVVVSITGCAAAHFHRKSHNGKAALSMIGMAVIFVAIPASPGDRTVSNSDRYMRGAIGLSYTFFMIVYCMLIAHQRRWYKGRCAIAGGLAIVMTIVGMASAPVQSYWIDSTKIDPFFALAIAIPASFTLCDLIAYLSDASNTRANTGPLELPAPVPGP
jgi:hypothetical protein